MSPCQGSLWLTELYAFSVPCKLVIGIIKIYLGDNYVVCHTAKAFNYWKDWSSWVFLWLKKKRPQR